MNLEHLRYPIGIYTPDKNPDREILSQWIADIEHFQERVERLVERATPEQLNWRYRPDGWMVKQVVHHCADSHINSIMRFKLALTEDTPTIRPYYEDRWVDLPDALTDDVEHTLSLLKGLHGKWVYLLKSLTDEQLRRDFIHPQHGETFNIAETIGTMRGTAIITSHISRSVSRQVGNMGS